MCEKDLFRLKAPTGWINDPNGFIFFGGQYHLFYQHFPFAPIWGRMHWGHAVSSDLVHWEHKGIALYPSKTEDRSGCFSGSAVEHNGKLHLFYTGVNYTEENPENINTYLNDGFISAQLSIVSEDGFTFDNIRDKTTVIPPISDSSIGSAVHTRDPKVWRGKDAWYMVLGSMAGGRGRLLFYKSADLKSWEYFNFAEKDGLGWMWECPDYFETEGGGVLIFSPLGLFNDGQQYESAAICTFADFSEETGEMDIADTYQFFDHGQDLYAPQSTLDEQGRRVVAAWARMPEPVDGKSGIFCIPRVVEARNGHIYFCPHPNAEKLFTREITSPKEAKGEVYKISLELSEGEEINIGGYEISRKNGRICADRSAVFPKNTGIRCRFETPEIKEGEHLDIYAGQNLVEVCINGGEYMLSNTVYGLTDKICGKSCVLYAAER
ncbi:MAG: glycoside hydrolase family 32 protein [Oscillospiraceae bacterium]